MNKEIIKQGYLKKIPTSKMGSFKRPDRKWFVFGVMNQTEPYIECYDTEDGIFKDTPSNFYSLKDCTKVDTEVRLGKSANIFAVFTTQKQITLMAQTPHVMDEWYRAIRSKLAKLGILEDRGEHIYTDGMQGIRPSLRRPVPPLPRVDNEANEALEQYAPVLPPRNMNRTQSTDDSFMSISGGDASALLENSADSPQPTLPARSSARLGPRSISLSGAYPPYPENRSLPALPPEYTETDPNPSSPTQSPLANEDLMAFSPLPAYTFAPGDRPATGQATYLPGAEGGQDLSVLPEKMVEALGLADEAVGGWNAPPSDDRSAPPPYVPRGATQCGKSLKQSQVEKLLEQKQNPGGVIVKLKQPDCRNTIAFIEYKQSVWIAGWNQRMRPFLSNALHIGDCVVSLNGHVVDTAAMARKIIKGCDERDTITFIIERIPHGKPLVITRKESGEDLGIRRVGGTAEINDVVPFGLAHQQGLSAKTKTPDGTNLCNWWITEINQRPLNLFFKEDEIEHRLQAVGKEISLLVHPIDFIDEMKKQLKSMKFYKDFIVE